MVLLSRKGGPKLPDKWYICAGIYTYTLLDIERKVPEVFGSVYDVRNLLQSIPILSDGRKISDMKLSLPDKMKLMEMLKMTEGTEAEDLMREYGLL